MKSLTIAKREDVYNAPIIDWNNETYTPLANKTIMDLIETKIHDLGLVINTEDYRVTRDTNNRIKGVIGAYNVNSIDKEFSHRIMFRNSYDKSMSFAFVEGLLVNICTNGCVSGDYVYKRVHKGVTDDNSSTTIRDVIANVDTGFKALQESFESTIKQLNQFKLCNVEPSESFRLLGELFFNREVLSVTQMSVIKRELEYSNNFRHLYDRYFTAYDLYNHITEALKLSNPRNYIRDHVDVHNLFIETFLT